MNPTILPSPRFARWSPYAQTAKFPADWTLHNDPALKTLSPKEGLAGFRACEAHLAGLLSNGVSAQEYAQTRSVLGNNLMRVFLYGPAETAQALYGAVRDSVVYSAPQFLKQLFEGTIKV